jgi:hypothetical protein
MPVRANPVQRDPRVRPAELAASPQSRLAKVRDTIGKTRRGLVRILCTRRVGRLRVTSHSHHAGQSLVSCLAVFGVLATLVVFAPHAPQASAAAAHGAANSLASEPRATHCFHDAPLRSAVCSSGWRRYVLPGAMMSGVAPASATGDVRGPVKVQRRRHQVQGSSQHDRPRPERPRNADRRAIGLGAAVPGTS